MKHTHDYIGGKCCICGEGQWRCMTCGVPVEDGQPCLMPACVDNRFRAERRMGMHERPLPGGDKGWCDA